MVKSEKLIQGLRQESRIAQYFGIAAFSLGPIVMILTSLQGRSGDKDNRPEMSFLLLLGFLALSHAHLARRIAQVAETLIKEDGPSN